MKKLFPHKNTNELCIALGRSYSSVSGRAYLLGLNKSEKFMKSEQSGRIPKLSQFGKKYQFEKGHVPLNKGRKWEEYMSPSAIEKSMATLFKKGIVPHNTKHDGYTRITKDGYIEVRVAKGKFMAVHRLVWEECNGPIPNGMIVVFKDKNPLNAAIENLECIDRSENMKRNTIYRYPTEVVSTIRALSKLKKAINGKKQNH